MNSTNDATWLRHHHVLCREGAHSLPRDRGSVQPAPTPRAPFVSNRGRHGHAAVESAGSASDWPTAHRRWAARLYSCFPARSSARRPRVGRSIAVIGPAASFAAVVKNYVMHAIATMSRRRAAPEAWTCWPRRLRPEDSSASIRPHRRAWFRRDHPPANRRAAPRDPLPRTCGRTATIEAYTVMHSREGEPETCIATCLLADGRRAWGTSTDPALAAAMCEGEWVGTRVTLTEQGTLAPQT